MHMHIQSANVHENKYMRLSICVSPYHKYIEKWQKRKNMQTTHGQHIKAQVTSLHPYFLSNACSMSTWEQQSCHRSTPVSRTHLPQQIVSWVMPWCSRAHPCSCQAWQTLQEHGTHQQTGQWSSRWCTCNFLLQDAAWCNLSWCRFRACKIHRLLPQTFLMAFWPQQCSKQVHYSASNLNKMCINNASKGASPVHQHCICSFVVHHTSPKLYQTHIKPSCLN